jgi:hypothetical protein
MPVTREDQEMEILELFIPFFPPTPHEQQKTRICQSAVHSESGRRPSIPAAGEQRTIGRSAAAPGPSETPSPSQAHTT